jgi:hypothetical protein
VGIEVTPVIEKVWKPHSRQEDFIRLPDSIFEAFYGGAAGGGKSDIIVMLPLVREWHLNPNWHGIVFRRTYPELEESLIMVSKKWFSHFGATYNDQKHFWKFPSGAIYRFSYLNTDEDARSHDTAQYHYIGFDELTHFTAFQYRYMISRIRRAEPGLPVLIRGASNPGNVGHGWVKQRFVAPWRIGYKPLKDKRSGTLRIFIPAKVTDNPHVMEHDPDYINRLKLLPLAEYKAKAEGDWDAYMGQVFSEFRTQRYSDEPEHAVHLVPYFQIPTWWPKILSIDWGYTANTSAHWGAISPDHRLFLYREYLAQKKQIANWGAEILALSQFDGNIRMVELDPSAWQNRGEEKLLWMQIQDALRPLVVRQADNDRIGGKMAIHEVLRWENRPQRYVPPEGYRHEREEWIYRNVGAKQARAYREMFDPDPPETNLPKCQILEGTCPALVDVIPQCVYAKPTKEGKPAEDVAEFPGDDPYDDFRYQVKGYERYLNEATEEHERIQKVEQLVALAGTDMTSFYRRAEEMEESKGNVVAFRPRLRRFR